MAGLISALVALLLPDVGSRSIEYGDAWHGVYGNKNDLGRAMALATATLVLVAMEGGRYRWLVWGAAAGAFLVLLLARAAASLVVCVTVLSLIPLFGALRLRFTAAMALWILTVLLAALMLTVVVSNLESTLSLLGRDTTLTGRTEIWEAVMASVAERPWLGYGFNAFWQEWTGPSASVLSAVGWETPHSHNGFLDLWLDLGAVGVIVFILGLVAAARASVIRARYAEGAADLWPLAFLTILTLINFSESLVLKLHSLFWVLYVAILASPRVARTSARPSRFPAGSGPQSPTDERVSGVPISRGHVSPGVRTAFWRRERHG